MKVGDATKVFVAVGLGVIEGAVVAVGEAVAVAV